MAKTRNERALTKSAEATIKKIREKPVISINESEELKYAQELIELCTRSEVFREIHNASMKLASLSSENLTGKSYDTFVRTANDEQKESVLRNLSRAQKAITILEAKLSSEV